MPSNPTHRAILLCALLLGVASTGGRSVAAQVVEPDGKDQGCTYCLWCTVSDVPGHMLQHDYLTSSKVIGMDHACVTGVCPGPHGTCAPQGPVFGFDNAAEVEAFEVRLAVASPGDLPALLGSYGRGVTFNRERRTLQLMGCGGRIVGNIPLESEQVAHLTATD